MQTISFKIKEIGYFFKPGSGSDKRDNGSTAFYFWKFIPTLVEGE